MRIVWVLVALGVAGFLPWQGRRSLEPGPGVLVSHPPSQQALQRPAAFTHGSFTIRPLARFTAQARVLSRHDYHFGTESKLSPTDLALGWGRMSDSAVLAGLDIGQSARWYHYAWQGAEPPIPLAEIVRSSANMHFIPANEQTAAALNAVRQGQVVQLQGFLIEASLDSGWRWRSSLSREDSGSGACEVVWLERIEVL